MKKKLAYVVSTPRTYLAFIKGHARILRDDYAITLISDFDSYPELSDFEDVAKIQVGIRRNISIFHDLTAMMRLIGVLWRGKFDIVHSITPKAGLLASIAGLLARCPVRVHTFTGQVWATKKGASRWLLKTIDKITLFSTTHSLADSNSQAEFLRSEGFSKPIGVLGDGAITGIDTERFRYDEAWRRNTRDRYSLAPDDFVFVFLGRLNRDKGVLDLVEGFSRANLGPRFKLLIIGPDEAGLTSIIEKNQFFKMGRIILTGRSTVPEKLLNAGDVLCLPSYREGFGVSILEGAAIGLPAIVSRIYGLTDAVIEGQTGIMHEAGNADEIAACLTVFAKDPQMAKQMGTEARARVLSNFSPSRVTKELRAFYGKVCQTI
ncbi:MAG: glycosyltransferase [Sneathiella sp.]|nr:glycosyltransferase [Sneathiella sp.]